MAYPYILNTGRLKGYMERISTVGIPEKVTYKYLYTLGFKSTNDRPIITILKFLKFLDNSGSPTSRYREYRDKERSRNVLGGSLRESYSDLFSIYPDANKKDTVTLQNYFSTNTGLGQLATKAMSNTFKALSSIANLGGGPIKKNESDNKLGGSNEDPVPESGVSISVNSIMGNNAFTATTKSEFKQLRKDIEKIWDAIELFWKEDLQKKDSDIHPGPKAGEPNTNVEGSSPQG